MTRTNLPLEILGLMSPLFSWIEGSRRREFPTNGHQSAVFANQGEISWLASETPSYSLDNLHEIVTFSTNASSTYESFDFLKKIHQLRRIHLVQSGKVNHCNPPENYDLLFIFRGLFDRYFQWSGNSLFIKDGRMVELHELMFRFPVGHILRYAYADAVSKGILSETDALQRSGRAYKIQTISRSLQTVVMRGLAEGHLHLNGVAGAGDTWAMLLLKNLADQNMDLFSAESNRLLILSRMALRLLTLGLLVQTLKRSEYLCPFEIIGKLDELYHAHGAANVRSARQGLSELMQTATDRLQGVVEDASVPLEACWLIPLVFPGAHLFRNHRNQSTPFFGFLEDQKALIHRIHYEVFHALILSDGAFKSFASDHQAESQRSINLSTVLDREFLHQVFYRYLIYHGHYWQSITQSGQTTGLQQFKIFFDSEIRTPFRNKSYRRSVVRRLTEGRLNTKIEGRLGPPKAGAASYRPWLRTFSGSENRKGVKKVGLVIHFIKAEKSESISNGSESTSPVCFHHTRLATRRDARRIFRLLSRPDPVTAFIVGIDAANLELTTPPEVFAPAFRFLRDYPIEIEGSDHGRYGLNFYQEVTELTSNRRLNMTYHVGEDFRHLLSGLRAIDEVRHFLHPLPGDRLGHAIALGLKPDLWLRQTGFQVVLPKLEWLDTLVWAHQFLGPGHPKVGALSLADRIQRYAKEIFAPGGLLPGQKDYGFSMYKSKDLQEADLNPATLHDAWLLRQLDPYSIDFDQLDAFKGETPLKSPPFVDRARKRWRDVQSNVWHEMHREVGTTAAYRFLELYWYSGHVRRVGSEIIAEDMYQEKHHWLPLMMDAQEKLQDLVRRGQIVIEANPSSNRLVGPISSYEEHPIFDLTLNQDGTLKQGIRVTVNTDNPGVFTTSLAHEYFILGETLLEQGIPEDKVLTWLEWLRENGHNASFLRDLPELEEAPIANMLKKFHEYDYDNQKERYFWRRARKV